MNRSDQMDRRFRAIAWGTLFILIGALSLIPGDQTGWAILGSGIILLGLNLERSISRIPLSRFSLVLGAVAFLVGALVLIRPVLDLHFKIDLFPIMLLVIGVYWLIPERRKSDSSPS